MHTTNSTWREVVSEALARQLVSCFDTQIASDRILVNTIRSSMRSRLAVSHSIDRPVLSALDGA